MIIFGFRGMAKLLGMVTLVCQRCGNPAAHRVVRHSRWFTLFFIPIFPISIKRSITCTFCGATSKVSKEQAEQLVPAQPSAAQQPIGPGMEQIPQAQQPHQQAPQGYQQQAPQAYPQQQPYPPAGPPQTPPQS